MFDDGTNRDAFIAARDGTDGMVGPLIGQHVDDRGSWLDVTVALGPATPFYEGDPIFRLEPLCRWSESQPRSYALSRIEMGTHSGTHLDAPAHFGGVLGVDEVDLNLLMGPALVLDLRGDPDEISSAVLARFDLRGVTRLVLRTAAQPNGEEGAASHGAGPDGGSGLVDSGLSAAVLTEDAARYLRCETAVRLVGIDALSVESGQGSGFPVHHILLREEPPIWIVETLDLRSVGSGWYDLVALPLKILGADAAPARVLLKYRPPMARD